MPTKAVCVVLLVIGCRGNERSAPHANGSGSAAAGSGVAGSGAVAGSAAKDPWVTADAGPDTPEARKARAAAALGRVAQIMPRLAKVRELEFVHDIPREYQSTDDFRKFV